MSTCLVALATLALGLLAPASATAAPGTPAVQLRSVSGSAQATPDGTIVAASFTVANRTSSRQAGRTAEVSLVDLGREPGPRRAYRLATVGTPALAPGADRTVSVDARAPRATTAGRYYVRVCFVRPDGPGRCALSKRPLVTVGDAVLTTSTDDLSVGKALNPSTTGPQDLVVTNTGQSRTKGLRLGLAGDRPGDFQVGRGTCTGWLAPGESCVLGVEFSPQPDASGRPSATLRVGGGGGGRGVPVEVTVRGEVGDPQVTMQPGSWDYGDVPVGGSATRTFTIVNDSDTDHTLSGGNLTLGQGPFYFDYIPSENTCLQFTVPAHGTCTFSVAFSPSATGPTAGVVEFWGTWGTLTSQLSGTGVDLGPVLAPTRRGPSARTYGR